MTATEVDGVAVIKDDPTEAPFLKHRETGAPLVWQKTRTLTLADGSVIYGCGGSPDCTYTSRNMLSIRPHQNAHRDGQRRPPTGNHPVGRRSALADVTLAEVETRLARLVQVEKDLTRWRSRALTAEKALATMRNALGVQR